MVEPRGDVPIAAVEVMETHVNCRCTMVPRAKSYAEILGDPTLADNRPKMESGPDAFARLSPAMQAEILGPGKFDLYQQGLPLEAFNQRVVDPQWGASRVGKPIYQLQRELEQMATGGLRWHDPETGQVFDLASRLAPPGPPPFPESFESQAQLQEWWNKAYPQAPLQFDGTALEQRAMVETMRGLDAMMRKYPQVARTVGVVNWTSFKNHKYAPSTAWAHVGNVAVHRWPSKVIPSVESGKASTHFIDAQWPKQMVEFNTDLYAQSNRDSHSMYALVFGPNSRYSTAAEAMRDPRSHALLQSMLLSEKTGYHSMTRGFPMNVVLLTDAQIDHLWRSTPTHEFGHMLDTYLQFASSGDSYRWSPVRQAYVVASGTFAPSPGLDQISEMWKQWRDRMPKVSTYAETTDHEKVAELFGNLEMLGDASPYLGARMTRRMIDYLLDEQDEVLTDAQRAQIEELFRELGLV